MEKYQVQFAEYLRLAKYSPATQKTYNNTVKQFLKFCARHRDDKDWDRSQAVRRYFLYRTDKCRLSNSAHVQDYSALLLFYTKVLGRKWDHNLLPRPAREFVLPKVLSVGDVGRIINAAGGTKARALLLLAYATGMRVSEICSLKTTDIDSQRMLIHVHHGKGAKDRMVALPEVLLGELRQYWRACRPTGHFLFNGERPGLPLSCRTAQWYFQQAKARAGLGQAKASIHTLRHCFATHSMEQGAELHAVRHLLGHGSIRTTSIYLHITADKIQQVPNPVNLICSKNMHSEP